MKKYILLLSMLLLVFNCSKKETMSKSTQKKMQIEGIQLPKVLFITTGVNFEKENKDLPKGIIVALQSFNKQGVPVRLEPRDVLFNQSFLNQYSIIILSTSTNYHDADRKYSLSYMTSEELNNIKEFVARGGTLIAGDNIGRNMFDGTDRILKAETLNSENYELADVFGLTMKEKNMNGYAIRGNINKLLQDELLETIQSEFWTLVPDSIVSNKLETLAYWYKDEDSIPAITQNRYHDGTAYLLASSDFINPIVEDGFWSVAQIESFYDLVLSKYKEQKHINISLNPWPNGYENAFCITFNPQGKIENYKNVVKFLKNKNIKPTFFVDGRLNDTIRSYLKSEKAILASSGYRYWNYDDIDYAISVNDILRNEAKWQQNFDGFRFPFTNPVFDGLMALDEQEYKYESSISANNFEFLHGSVVPYNLVINQNGFYKSTSILEIAPTYHDDYFFLEKLAGEGYKNERELIDNVQLHKQYLHDYWKYSVKPYHGVMVYLGHPGITAYNQTTLNALSSIIDSVSVQNTWITTIDSIADYRSKLTNISFLYKKKKNKIYLACVSNKKISIPNFSLNIAQKPNKVTATIGDVQVKQSGEHYNIIFNAVHQQELIIEQ